MKYLFGAKLETLLKDENQVWAEIAREGTWSGYEVIGSDGSPTKRTVSISSKALDEMVRNFEDESVTNHKRVDIHISHPGSVDYAPGAVGWITKLERRGTKLFGLLSFLETFASQIKEGKWAGFSIEALSSAVHPVSGKPIGAYLTGLGVTNRPFIRGMEFPGLSQINGNEAASLVYLSCNDEDLIAMSEQKDQTKEEIKAAETVEVEKEVETTSDCPLCKALATALGKPDASPEELAAMLVAMKEKPEEAKKEAPPAESLQASQLAFETQVSNLTMQLSQVTEEAKVLREKVAAFETKEISSSIDEAIKAGKIHASQKENFHKLAVMNRELFRSIVDAAPKIQLGQMLPSSVLAEKSEADKLAEELIAKGRNKK